jgi:hypothetical protein
MQRRRPWACGLLGTPSPLVGVGHSYSVLAAQIAPEVLLAVTLEQWRVQGRPGIR